MRYHATAPSTPAAMTICSPHRGGPAMTPSIDRRAFLLRTGTVAAGLLGGPLLSASPARAAGERLVVAVGQWGIETPFAWRSSQSEKTLWDCVYDPLIQ